MAEIISSFALLLSVYATWKTVKFNQKQKELIATQSELSKLLLRKETNDALDSLKADIAANFIKLGSSRYRLKIFNKGQNIARNVRIEFPGGNETVSKNDIQSKFPLERLEQYQPVELHADVSHNTPGKVVIKMIWDDDSKCDNEKVLYPTI